MTWGGFHDLFLSSSSVLQPPLRLRLLLVMLLLLLLPLVLWFFWYSVRPWV